MALEILHFSNQRHDNQDFARVMASTRDISRFGGGPITQSYMHFRSVRKQNLEYLQRCDVKRVQSWAEDWLMQNFELSKDFTFANYQNHQTTVKMLHQPTKVTKTTSIMEPSLIEPISVTVHRSRHNHGRMDQHKRGKVSLVGIPSKIVKSKKLPYLMVVFA